MVPTFGENCSLSSRDPVAGRVSVCWRPVLRNHPLEARNARADAEPGWRGIGPTAFFTAALPAIEGEIGSPTFLAAGTGAPPRAKWAEWVRQYYLQELWRGRE